MMIGIVGCGNMGNALITGMLKSGFVMPGELSIYDVDDEKMDKISRKYGAERSESIVGLIGKSDYIILAIKPQDCEKLLSDYQEILNVDKKILITIVAGKSIAFYRRFLPSIPIARVMPNTPAIVGEGASGIYFDGNFKENEKSAVVKMFESCGIAEVVGKEELLDAVTGLSGSGPAYVFAFINSMADGAVMEGLPRETAKRLAIQTALGAAKLAQTSNEDGIHLEDLKDRVTSPGGTTAAGLYALEKGAFRAAIIDAVSQATKRAKELGAK